MMISVVAESSIYTMKRKLYTYVPYDEIDFIL